jgi:hypothetical protein
MEHRWGQRIPVDIQVQLRARPRAIGVGRIANLSISGAWIETKSRLPLLAQIQVVVKPSRLGRHRAGSVAAFVTRRSKTGIGVEWRQMAPQHITVLLQAATRTAPMRIPPTYARARVQVNRVGAN